MICEVVDVKINGAWLILLNCMLFPVPDGPVISMGLRFFESWLMIKEYRIVSKVYTIIEWKGCYFW